MTNGEKLKEVFPSIELYEKSHDAIQINFDSVWWNAEYKEPTTKNDLGVDCIDRNSIKYYPGTGGYMYASKGEIDKLPSVTPQEPKTGHWIDKQHLLSMCSAECSECKKRASGYIVDNGFSLEYKFYDYCPNCGADMREVEE